MTSSWGRRLLAAAALAVATAGPALAHPHIFIDAKVEIGFDAQGRVAQLHHSWTFDTAFSVWMVQGLDANGDGLVSPEEMQDLANENMEGLATYGFYTSAGDGMHFVPAGDQRMRYENERVTLDFTAIAETPQLPGSRFELGVFDPEYYVAISFGGPQDVTLSNAPASCTTTLEPPKPMAPDVEERLYALGPEVLELPPDLAAAMRGTQGLIALSCGPAPAASTALEAVTQVAQSRPAPFGGPPVEPGLNLPRTGFFGWLQDQQRQFYGAMTGSLAALRTDWTAFWLLGGLSFLYGVVHAAGPGHGKVVISSYVLANERQLRRGIWLSFLSAMMQSAVAIVFVLVLAGILRLTSTAMGDAAYWVGLLSYALVALLGLWLVIRKIFGLGHRHDHGDDHHHDHDHGHRRHIHWGDEPAEKPGQGHDHHDHPHHDHDHHHHGDHDHHGHTPLEAGHMHHAVGPMPSGRSWREQAAVVLAVGMRPCSGALVVLVFALSQGVLAAGMAAVVLMGLGTAITVAILATLAVAGKGLAMRLAGADGPAARAVAWWAELLGAIAVLAFGVMLVIASL